MTRIAVTGANGFIGRHLLHDLVASGWQVRALVRRKPNEGMDHGGVEWVIGDIADGDVWHRLAEPGGTVINLAHSNASSSASLDATKRMVEACGTIGIARLIHCSTVSVYGRGDEVDLTEDSRCNPLNDYGRIKLAVERELVGGANGRFALVIVRPTVVFGAGGEALTKLAGDLTHAPRLINYLRSSLFGRRRTHLVPVETVAAALRFLSSPDLNVNGGTFIVSDDHDPLNNFCDVERILMNVLRVPDYSVPRIPLPSVLLKGLLTVRGRSEIDPNCVYRGDKLLSCGFHSPVKLEVALRAYASAFRAANRQGSSN